jgi:DNA-binding transcriptional LysR family regulator
MTGPLLDLRRLEVLREVAAHGSFSAAAFALRYTPSAVSQQMALLEQEAGVPLLERHSRGVRLTPAGDTLLRHAEAAVGHMRAAREELDALAGLRRGRLATAAFGSAWSDLVPRAVATFQRAHPEVELVLSEADPRESLAALRAGGLDLALVFEPNAADPSHRVAVRVEPLAEDPLVVVLPAGHRLARRPAVALADLAAERWALATDACAEQTIGACAAAGFTPEAAFASATTQPSRASSPPGTRSRSCPRSPPRTVAPTSSSGRRPATAPCARSRSPLRSPGTASRSRPRWWTRFAPPLRARRARSRRARSRRRPRPRAAAPRGPSTRSRRSSP